MTNPHDALFQYTFSQPEHAAKLIASNLPVAIAERIDWASLERVPGSFVDQELAWRHTDLLFRAKLAGREALIYLLLEHQSTTDPLMALRLLGYLNRIWEKVLKSDPNAKLVPAVIPLVLYHGTRGWSAPTRFLDLVDLDEQSKQILAPLLPSFGYLLDDLSGQSDQQLRARAVTQMGLLTLLSLQRLPNAPDPEGAVRDMTDLMAAVIKAPSGVQALAAVLCYLFKVSDPEPSAIKDLLEVKVGGQAVEAYMTAADRLKQQGRLEGRAEGEAKGRAEIVIKQLTLRFGSLPANIVDRVRSSSTQELDLWAERVLTAQSLEDVLS